jgi:2-keto-4-pentenoate hydratase/2-oxohepta-3-ene-1,7-dioic acid hydratase in catechol pathway
MELPAVSSFFDYEGELGVVIGRAGRNISPERALEYVAGYTICNDGSARDLQNTTLAGKPTIDWFSAKAIDNSSPVGPWIVTRDEVSDPQNLRIQTRLNGDAVQDDRTSSMVFSIADQVAYISKRLTIRPGDLIATGTPAGVGKARGRALRPGDELEIEIERIGVLRSRFTAPVAKRS